MGKYMQPTMLATDVVLQALVGPSKGLIESLIMQAQNGKTRLTVLHSTLYCAVISVRPSDTLNTHRFAELLKYSEIIPDEPQYLGPQERDSWVPTSKEIEHWRKLALGEQ